MATSGSVDFNLTRNEIVTDALKLIEAIEAGETPSSEEMADGARALNRMVKAWQAKGYHLWSKDEAVLFLTVGQASYKLGPGSTDHAVRAEDLTSTTLSAAAATSATTLTVSSITGISSVDNIGVILDDGSFHWTTVNGAPSGSTVTLTAAMPSAAASGNKVYAYTSGLDRPLRVMDARRRDSSDQDVPIIVFSREEYFQTPNKTTQAKTTQVYYDPQLTDGQIYLWPTPDSVSDQIRFTHAASLQDFDAATNNPHFPQEWLDALTWNLAVRLSPEYSVPLEKRMWLKSEALEMLNDAMSWDSEATSVFFGVES